MALTIFIVLMVMVIPSQEFFFKKTKEQVIGSQLFRAINLARSEAITRHLTVVLCKSRDQKTCSGDWKDGYIIYSQEKVLHSLRLVDNKGVLNLRAYPKWRGDVQFISSGFSRTDNGTFWYCSIGAKNPAWAIVFSKAGRPRMVNSNKSGEIEIEKGKKIVC
jgi:type IV fimbrial biogenesis protein FimT